MRWDISSLKFMYNMERFATQIYLMQWKVFDEESVLKKLDSAAENEQKHVNVLRKRIMELQGNRPHIGFLFQAAAGILGSAAGAFGTEFVLKLNVFVENRAIKDYGAFLKRVEFDEDTINLINRIIADEVFHRDTWQLSIEELAGHEA